ncbi:MAG: sulfatase [Acidobacteria bacterium]|nr:sulfatase [Acidobacteriota bacterium]
MVGPRPGARLFLLLTLLTTASACRQREDTRPNLIIILVDTLRSDHLHSYGYPRETSPSLDALARRGILFEQAISAAPWTLPSAMSLLTGRLPSSHRVENDGMKLAPGIPILAEVLKQAGYVTAAVVSHIYVDSPFGFQRGFDRFDDFGLSKDYRFEAGLEPIAGQVTDHALVEIRRMEKGRPFFLLVHYFDPHWDYDPPAPYDSRFTTPYSGTVTGSYQSFSKYALPGETLPPGALQHLIDLYDGEIAYTDAQIGRLLQILEKEGVARRSVVVVVSDHGEEFKEHGSLGHGRDLYDEVTRVPLIVADLRKPVQERRVEEEVRSIDVFPTLCALAEVIPPRGVQGASLIPFLSGERGEARPAISETIRFDAYKKSYREPHAKLIVGLESNSRELYDLQSDPAERINLWERRGQEALAMEQALFEQVDVLNGGWNLRWSSDGSPHRFSGSIETEGLITAVVPLFPQAGRHRVARGKRIDFDLEGVSGSGGLSFAVSPSDSRVGFSLALDGAPEKRRVFVGARRTTPTASPFTFASAEPAELFSKPAFSSGRELGYFLWKSPGPSQEEASELTEAMKERLRSLGYIR